MIEATINGWILTIGGDRYVYTDKQVDDYLLNNHFDELEPYMIKRDVYFGGCVDESSTYQQNHQYHVASRYDL